MRGVANLLLWFGRYLGYEETQRKNEIELTTYPCYPVVPKEARSGEIHCLYRTVSVRMKNV